MILVSFDIKDYEVTTKLISKAKELGDMFMVLPNVFALDVQYTDDIAKQLMKIAEGVGRICVAEIHRKTMNGWFATECVSWINSKSF